MLLNDFANTVGVGKITEGKHVERNKHRKPFWIWTLWRKQDVANLLSQMLPLLGERRGYVALNALDVLDGVS